MTPVYNRDDCIGRCIESVIRNLHDEIDLEHIIVDDGSTDESARIIFEYARQYSHINFIRLNVNQGPNTARNVAVKEAKGNFCIILDSDDFFVDDAILTILTVMQQFPHYRHYLLAPNDMSSKYEQNDLLKGCEHKELLFVDFLSGRVSQDYVHIIDTDVMKQYPFDESLRIYEGVFFLRFYREVQRILFTNKIVTIRERSRSDSVTRETFRTSREIIERTIKATELNIKWFKNDYEEMGLWAILNHTYQKLLDNLLMLDRYSDCKQCMNFLIRNGGSVTALHKMIYKLRIGWLYRIAIKWYLTLKYKIININLK